jgi:hypothetical protein
MHLSSFLLTFLFLFTTFEIFVATQDGDIITYSYNYNKGTLRKKEDESHLPQVDVLIALPTISFSVDLSTSDFKSNGFATALNQQSFSFDLNSKYFSYGEYYYYYDDDAYSNDEQK